MLSMLHLGGFVTIVGSYFSFLVPFPSCSHLPPQAVRSFGSGFELVELHHIPGHCPPFMSQTSPTVVVMDLESRKGRESREGHDCNASSASSCSGDKELPPEDAWRDGLFDCFSGFGMRWDESSMNICLFASNHIHA